MKQNVLDYWSTKVSFFSRLAIDHAFCLVWIVSPLEVGRVASQSRERWM